MVTDGIPNDISRKLNYLAAAAAIAGACLSAGVTLLAVLLAQGWPQQESLLYRPLREGLGLFQLAGVLIILGTVCYELGRAQPLAARLSVPVITLVKLFLSVALARLLLVLALALLARTFLYLVQPGLPALPRLGCEAAGLFLAWGVTTLLLPPPLQMPGLAYGYRGNST